MNRFQPSVKLVRKVRVGSWLRRVYDRPQTPLDRLLATGAGDPAKIAAFQQLRTRLDPFALAEAVSRRDPNPQGNVLIDDLARITGSRLTSPAKHEVR